jgi:hypothetical protein
VDYCLYNALQSGLADTPTAALYATMPYDRLSVLSEVAKVGVTVTSLNHTNHHSFQFLDLNHADSQGSVCAVRHRAGCNRRCADQVGAGREGNGSRGLCGVQNTGCN